MTIDSRLLRNTLGLFVTGVTIITTRGLDGEPVGLTANSFNSVSLDPPLVLWSIGHTSLSKAAFDSANHFAVHILRADQQELSNTFAKRGVEKFRDVEISLGLGDVPLLPDCAACLECSVYSRHPAGDHSIYVAQIERMRSDPDSSPLVYHGGQYTSLADMG